MPLSPSAPPPSTPPVHPSFTHPLSIQVYMDESCFNYPAFVLIISVFAFSGVCRVLPCGSFSGRRWRQFLRRDDKDQQYLGKCVYIIFFISSSLITWSVSVLHPPTLCPCGPPHPSPPWSSPIQPLQPPVSPPLHPLPSSFQMYIDEYCFWLSNFCISHFCLYFFGVCWALPHGSVSLGGHERVP